MNTRFGIIGTAVVSSVLAAAAGTARADAQPVRELARADVPFAFQYGTRALPAGDYGSALLAEHILAVRGEGSAVFGLVLWAGDDKQPAKGRLVFHWVGDRYVLQDLWAPSLSAHLMCPKVKQRRAQEIVDARGAGAVVEIAMVESPR